MMQVVKALSFDKYEMSPQNERWKKGYESTHLEIIELTRNLRMWLSELTGQNNI